MRADCHMHMVLDGIDWKQAIARHSLRPDEGFIRAALATYRDRGITYLRDGGDRWGVGAKAREFAPDYGITYRTPLAPICRRGHYGEFIGISYENLQDYTDLVVKTRENGGNFIKIMVSGLMDFSHYGELTQPGLDPKEIEQLIHIAHREGMSVMAHANGAETVLAAATAGVDSVEHGAYLNEEALSAMAEMGTVWVPTLSTVGNLQGKGRFPDRETALILESALENVENFRKMGGILAAGTDAGAWAVPHGSLTEYELLEEILGEKTQEILDRGIQAVREKF